MSLRFMRGLLLKLLASLHAGYVIYLLFSGELFASTLAFALGFAAFKALQGWQSSLEDLWLQQRSAELCFLIDLAGIYVDLSLYLPQSGFGLRALAGLLVLPPLLLEEVLPGFLATSIRLFKEKQDRALGLFVGALLGRFIGLLRCLTFVLQIEAAAASRQRETLWMLGAVAFLMGSYSVATRALFFHSVVGAFHYILEKTWGRARIRVTIIILCVLFIGFHHQTTLSVLALLIQVPFWLPYVSPRVLPVNFELAEMSAVWGHVEATLLMHVFLAVAWTDWSSYGVRNFLRCVAAVLFVSTVYQYYQWFRACVSFHCQICMSACQADFKKFYHCERSLQALSPELAFDRSCTPPNLNRQVHCICSDCFPNYVRSTISGSRKRAPTPVCLSCKAPIAENVISSLVDSSLMARYSMAMLDFSLQAALQPGEVLIRCQKQACTNAVIYLGQRPDLFTCRCGFAICFKCNTNLEAGGDQDEHKCDTWRVLDVVFEEELLAAATRRCPTCGAGGIKDLECTHITCEECEEHWCYHCGKTRDSLLHQDSSCPLLLQQHPDYTDDTRSPAVALQRFHLKLQRTAVAEKMRSMLTDHTLTDATLKEYCERPNNRLTGVFDMTQLPSVLES